MIEIGCNAVAGTEKNTRIDCKALFLDKGKGSSVNVSRTQISPRRPEMILLSPFPFVFIYSKPRIRTSDSARTTLFFLHHLDLLLYYFQGYGDNSPPLQVFPGTPHSRSPLNPLFDPHILLQAMINQHGDRYPCPKGYA